MEFPAAKLSLSVLAQLQMDPARNSALRRLLLVSLGVSLLATLKPTERIRPSNLSSAVNVAENVPSNISTPAVHSSEPLDMHPAPQTPVQNHIYKLESGLGDPSQEAFRLDQELLARGWDAKRYPWRMIQQDASRKAILYGTAWAQQMIWDHQHPRSSAEPFVSGCGFLDRSWA